jgi:hypothetical protein
MKTSRQKSKEKPGRSWEFFTEELAHSELERDWILNFFWGKVDRLLPGCWEWPEKYRNEAGYGIFQYKSIRLNRSITISAHRFSLIVTVGNQPTLLACHSCDNPPYIRPSHLFWGTHKENSRDMVIKGRGQRQFGSSVKIDEEMIAKAFMAYDREFHNGRYAAMRAAVEQVFLDIFKGDFHKTYREEIKMLEAANERLRKLLPKKDSV